MPSTTYPGLLEGAPTFITAEWLREREACYPALATFTKHWPDGAELSEEGLLEVGKLELSITWLADNLLTPEALKAYYEARATAWTTHYEACVPVLTLDDEACFTAWKVYNEACARHLWRALTKTH